jgi:hypothetical protein
VEAGQHGFPTVNGGVTRLAGDVVFACQFIGEVSPPELQRVRFGESCVVYVTHLFEEAGVFFCTCDPKRRQCIFLIFYKNLRVGPSSADSMDAILMSSSLHPTEEEFLFHEVRALKASLTAETERCVQMGAEIARLNAALYDANVERVGLLEICNERDEYKKQLEEQVPPLEAQLAETKRVLLEQMIQFRSVVDVLATQRDWVREWALQCQENQRLRDRLVRHEAGTEVEALRSQLLTAHSAFVELHVAFKHRGVVISQLESKISMSGMEITRLTGEGNVQKEQFRRLWKRVASFDASEKH